MSDSSQLALRLHGRVQGVGFRWWCARAAKGLGVIGDVRNCDDGTVEVRAQGSAEVLERFRLRLAEGPPMARVDELEPFEIEADHEPGEEFRIHS